MFPTKAPLALTRGESSMAATQLPLSFAGSQTTVFPKAPTPTAQKYHPKTPSLPFLDDFTIPP